MELIRNVFLRIDEEFSSVGRPYCIKASTINIATVPIKYTRLYILLNVLYLHNIYHIYLYIKIF